MEEEVKTMKKKKTYCKPEMQVEEFAPNEYIAACYKVKCDCPHGYSLWLESNGEEGLQTTGRNRDEEVYQSGGFSGCNEWHKGVEVDPTLNGYVVTHKGGWGQSPTYEKVFVWKESLGSDVDWHASTLKEQYVTNPNAS